MAWSVAGDSTTVDACSSVRLPFEPNGELYEYRDALRAALRKLGPAPGHGLVATYLSPDSEFVDAENLLLYNVGAGSYSHLVAGGLFVSREQSADDLHHLRYQVAPMPVLPPGDRLASTESTVPVDLHSPGAWWSALRSPMRVAHLGSVDMGAFTLDVTLHGSWTGPTVAGVVKPLLDGLVSALHAHDGADHDVLLPRLAHLGQPDDMWSLLCSPDAAVLGTRRLIRPHGERIAWNPADDLCSACRVRVVDGADRRVTAVVRTAMDHM